MKVDNGDLAAKLALRRYFLKKYHGRGASPARVFDCCQGAGVIWGRLAEEFELGSYWGVDLKEKKGRLKLDSVRVIGQPGWAENVVDVDTYGSPWKHWMALLPHVVRPVTVFLTIGQLQMGTDKEILRALGLGALRVPPGIAVRLHGISFSYLLARAFEYDIKIIEGKEVVSFGNARYVGVRIAPNKTAGRGLQPPTGQPQRTCKGGPP